MNKTMTFQVNSTNTVIDEYANPSSSHYSGNPEHTRKIFASINFEVEIPVGKHYADTDYAQLEADVLNVVKIATDNSRMMLDAMRPVGSNNYRYPAEPSENPDAGFILKTDVHWRGLF
jgi:hypothetical protein